MLTPGPPLQPSGDEGRRLLRDELLHGEYHRRQLLQRILGWLISVTGNVALVYGVIGILTIGIAVVFRLFTALGDAQRYVDERQAEERRLSTEAVTA
jgi:hypothetical protein